MSDLLIENVRIVRPGQDIRPGSVTIRAGKIVDAFDGGRAGRTIDGGSEG